MLQLAAASSRRCQALAGLASGRAGVLALATRLGSGAASQKLRLVKVPELCTAERLARELRLPLPKLQSAAEALGEPIDTASRPLPQELIELLAEEVGGVDVRIISVDAVGRGPPADSERAALPLRPPVVTLMGHVDHGKTSLLDALRDSQLAAAEAGGITQGISAFTVGEAAEAMTVIDTPGHELFSAMRRRGAKATDVVVLVVAVDAGVQPTTVQAIEYARATDAPLVVAANKIDKPDAERQLSKLTSQLLEHGVVAEEMGGETPVLGVSATKRIGLDELREAVLLQAELLELHEFADGPAEGVVLESAVVKGLGPVASVLVQRGSLKPSDHVVAGCAWGRVKALEGDGRARPRAAGPSTPVRVSGFRELPSTGDEVLVVASEARAKEVVEYRKARRSLEAAAQAEAEASARAAARAAGRERAGPSSSGGEGARGSSGFCRRSPH